MGSDEDFIFRDTVFKCDYYVDNSQLPYLIFVTLYDDKLIARFGEELTIKTDFKTNLPHRDDHKELTELKNAIFSAIKTGTDFIIASRLYVE